MQLVTPDSQVKGSQPHKGGEVHPQTRVNSTVRRDTFLLSPLRNDGMKMILRFLLSALIPSPYSFPLPNLSEFKSRCNPTPDNLVVSLLLLPSPAIC